MKKVLLSSVVCAAAVASVASCGNESSDDDDDDFVDALATFDCEAETRDEDFFAGMSKTGANGTEVILIDSLPSPPGRGDSTFTIELRDENNDLIEGASLGLVPFMPDHNHGTPIDAEITPIEGSPGRYKAQPVNLWMPGVWEITMEVTAPVEDEVLFTFCISG
jgi:hypothetical protein